MRLLAPEIGMSAEPSRPDADTTAGEGRPERRKRSIPVASDSRRMAGDDASDKPDRRRLVDPTTCEKEYSDDEIAFMKAMDQYKRDNRRPFPTWSEVLEVLVSLGYRKVAEQTQLPGNAPRPTS
jgi:hypothetical protein